MLKDWGVAITLAVLVYVLIGWLQPRMDLPDDAPAIALRTLDGEPWSLEAHAGKTVVVNFWATWCGPCKKEIPDFSRFAVDHPEVKVIGISMDTLPPARVRAEAKRLGVRYPVAMADSGVRDAYGVRTLPTTVIVGPDGQIVHLRVGTMNYQALVRAVAKSPG